VTLIIAEYDLHLSVPGIKPELQKVTRSTFNEKKCKMFCPESGPDHFSEMTKEENYDEDECK
jgi:hypothetical protein